MKFVILSNRKIPGFGGIKGPILTPQEIPLKKVLDMVSSGFEVFEVMEDGSRRKVQFSDERIISEIIKQKLEKKICQVYTPFDSEKEEEKLDSNIFEKTSDKDIDTIIDIEKSTICNTTRGKDENKESEEKQSKKDKKNNKSDKKTELPKIDDVEEISDDK